MGGTAVIGKQVAQHPDLLQGTLAKRHGTQDLPDHERPHLSFRLRMVIDRAINQRLERGCIGCCENAGTDGQPLVVAQHRQHAPEPQEHFLRKLSGRDGHKAWLGPAEVGCQLVPPCRVRPQAAQVLHVDNRAMVEFRQAVQRFQERRLGLILDDDVSVSQRRMRAGLEDKRRGDGVLLAGRRVPINTSHVLDARNRQFRDRHACRRGARRARWRLGRNRNPPGREFGSPGRAVNAVHPWRSAGLDLHLAREGDRVAFPNP